MQLSIIIPVYNVEAYLEECLNSCLEQDIPHTDYEIIAINDGSPDGSLAILERYADKYPNITVLSQENKGLSATRNRGIEVAKGEYIWFIDSDDWIEKDCLSSLLGHTEDVVMFGGIYNDMKEGFVIRHFNPRRINDIAASPMLPINTVSYLFKSTFLKDNELRFEEGHYYEDFIIAPLFLHLARSIGYIDRVVYFYRKNASSITQTFSKKKGIDHYYVIQKMFEYQQTYSTPGDKWFPFFQRYIDTAFSYFFLFSIKLPRSERREVYRVLEQNKELLQAQSKSIGRNMKSFLLCHAKDILFLYILVEEIVLMPLKRKLISLKEKDLT